MTCTVTSQVTYMYNQGCEFGNFQRKVFRNFFLNFPGISCLSKNTTVNVTRRTTELETDLYILQENKQLVDLWFGYDETVGFYVLLTVFHVLHGINNPSV